MLSNEGSPSPKVGPGFGPLKSQIDDESCFVAARGAEFDQIFLRRKETFSPLASCFSPFAEYLILLSLETCHRSFRPGSSWFHQSYLLLSIALYREPYFFRPLLSIGALLSQRIETNQYIFWLEQSPSPSRTIRGHKSFPSKSSRVDRRKRTTKAGENNMVGRSPQTRGESESEKAR